MPRQKVFLTATKRPNHDARAQGVVSNFLGRVYEQTIGNGACNRVAKKETSMDYAKFPSKSYYYNSLEALKKFTGKSNG